MELLLRPLLGITLSKYGLINDGSESMSHQKDAYNGHKFSEHACDSVLINIYIYVFDMSINVKLLSVICMGNA